MPRSIPINRKQVSYIDINSFSYASLTGVCTVAYAVVNQQNTFSQSLISKTKVIYTASRVSSGT